VAQVSAMNTTDYKEISEALIARYLLGELSADEQEQIDLALGDDEFFARVTAVEQDLIDDYAQGNLSRSARERFEQRFLNTPRQREQVAKAKAFYQAARQQPAVVRTPQGSWWQSFVELFRLPTPALSFGLATAALVLTVGGAWLAYEAWRLRGQASEVAVLRQENTEQRRRFEDELRRRQEQLSQAETTRQQLQAQVQDLERTRSLSPLTIDAPSSRGGEVIRDPNVRKLQLRADADIALLQLKLSGDTNRSHKVELKTAAGRTVLTMNGLRTQSYEGGKILKINFPARLLAAGRYQLQVTGNDDGRQWIFELEVEGR
jgi:hypothetical protein